MCTKVDDIQNLLSALQNLLEPSTFQGDRSLMAAVAAEARRQGVAKVLSFMRQEIKEAAEAGVGR